MGLCRDPEPDSGLSGCEADPRTLDFIRRILDDEKPQLAVLTGDQINGDSTKDIQTTLFKFAELFISRRIPFATILGNHDDEGAMTRKQIMELTASLPYSLSEVGPELGPMVKDTKGREIPEGGVGNYLVEVVTHNRVEHPALSLYFLDSHSYTTAPKEKGYGWIENSQIDWFKNKVKAVKAAHDKYIYMHLNMAFIHIPLPEYRLTGLPIVGEKREAIMAPTHNTGFKDALVAAEVGVVSVGHDHANDFCMLDQLWMCYAGGAGFGGYGGYNNYIRRVRIFQIDGDRNEIVTWKRIQHGDKNALKNRLDRQILVKDGKPVVPPPGTVSV